MRIFEVLDNNHDAMVTFLNVQVGSQKVHRLYRATVCDEQHCLYKQWYLPHSSSQINHTV